MMDDVQIKILNFLSKAPDTYWRAHSIKRRTVEASKFEKVDAWDFGRCLRELREEGLVKKNDSRLGGWRITEKGLEMLRGID